MEQGTNRFNDDDWEVVDDDGFVYKRRKRRGVTDATATVVRSQKPVFSKEEELRASEAFARRKKLAMLLAQKEMYTAEIADWEMLLKKQEELLACAPISQTPPNPERVSLQGAEDTTTKEILATLQLLVEAYEQYTKQFQVVREQVESACKKLEMDLVSNTSLELEIDEGNNRIPLVQKLLKEAVKKTPRTIIHSLTSETALARSLAEDGN